MKTPQTTEARCRKELRSAQEKLRRMARENYGLLLLLQDVHDVSADALRATAESRARDALGR